MTPEKWGKYYWTCIHLTALSYPDSPTESDRKDYFNFYKTFGIGLPCFKCRENYKRHFEQIPIELFLYDKTQLFNWTVKMHNVVNVELKKTEWTYDEAWKHYNNQLFLKEEQKDQEQYAIKSFMPPMSFMTSFDFNKPLIFLNVVLLLVLLIMIFYYLLNKK